MKKQLLAGFVALAAAAAALSGCNGGGSEVSVSQTESSAVQPATIPETIEAATTAPEPTTQKPEYNAEDYVRTDKECEIEYSGAFLITGEEVRSSETARCRQPQLTINSADAQAVNSEIKERTDSIIDEIAKSDRPWCRTDYVCYINGNILSLVNELRSVDTPNSSFLVYNFNVETGERLSNSDIFSAAGISDDKACEMVKADMTPRFDELEGKASNPTLESQINEAREKTLADENVNSADFFFDGEGNLCTCYRYYWVAGAENYGTVASLDAAYNG